MALLGLYCKSLQMVSFSNILLPVDFSERSLACARYAIPLAERFQSTVTFLYVVPAEDRQKLGDAEQIRNAQNKLDNFVSAEFHHLRTKRIVRPGDPATEIAALAKAEGSDLIMISTHGYGAFRRKILGSVTAKVLYDVDCPVWTSAHLDEEPGGGSKMPANILCAVDIRTEGEATLRWASEFASLLQGSLSLIHVEPRFESLGEDYYSSDLYSKILAEAKEKLAQLQRRLGTHAEAHVGAGRVVESVCRSVSELQADILIIGRGSGSGSGRLGLNTYGIIRESACPVISV